MYTAEGYDKLYKKQNEEWAKVLNCLKSGLYSYDMPDFWQQPQVVKFLEAKKVAQDYYIVWTKPRGDTK